MPGSCVGEIRVLATVTVIIFALIDFHSAGQGDELIGALEVIDRCTEKAGLKRPAFLIGSRLRVNRYLLHR